MTTPVSPVREYQAFAETTRTFGRVHASARTNHLVVDGPVQNGCPGEAITPPEMFLASVASCGAELVQVIARDEGVPLESVHVAVAGAVDRSRQSRADVTVFNSVRLDFTIAGTDGASAAALVEGFKRR